MFAEDSVVVGGGVERRWTDFWLTCWGLVSLTDSDCFILKSPFEDMQIYPWSALKITNPTSENITSSPVIALTLLLQVGSAVKSLKTLVEKLWYDDYLDNMALLDTTELSSVLLIYCVQR